MLPVELWKSNKHRMEWNLLANSIYMCVLVNRYARCQQDRTNRTLPILVAILSTHGLNCKNFDKVKLARLKYLQLCKPRNEPIFEMVGVDVFRDWLLDLWNTLIQWISCVKVALNFLFRLNVKHVHVGRMNAEPVGLIGRLSEQWTRWLEA